MKLFLLRVPRAFSVPALLEKGVVQLKCTFTESGVNTCLVFVTIVQK